MANPNNIFRAYENMSRYFREIDLALGKWRKILKSIYKICKIF